MSQAHHQPKQAISHLQELEDQEEVKETSEGTTSSLHGVEAYCKGVDFAPTNHKEKREMAEKGITTWHKLSQASIFVCSSKQSIFPKPIIEKKKTGFILLHGKKT